MSQLEQKNSETAYFLIFSHIVCGYFCKSQNLLSNPRVQPLCGTLLLVTDEVIGL